MSQKLQKMGKNCNILKFSSETFLQFKKFLIENDTGYDLCIFNYLRFKRGREKKRKLDHREYYQINDNHGMGFVSIG